MPKPPFSHSNEIVLAPEVVHFDPNAFDIAMRGNGVVYQHHAAILCPFGENDRFDVRSHGDHPGCSNGFVYKYVGDVTAFTSGNSSTSSLSEPGFIDGSSVQVTVPRFYDNAPDKEVLVQHYDRFYFKQVVTKSVNTQKVEAHVTGVDRLQYPAVGVEFIQDANGVWYEPGDYKLDSNGNIDWRGSTKRPQFDPKLNKGTVYSIRYHYIPFWYVKNIVHEVRVARSFDMTVQEEKVERMPYALVLQREYVFEDQERSADPSHNTVRSVKSPRNGSFGPR